MSTPATYHGAGFTVRSQSHAQDMGRLWADVGLASEIGPLRAVLLSRPPETLALVDDPDAWLMLGRPDPVALHAAADRLAGAYERLGVAVHWIEAPQAPPNLLFARDLFWMTPEGAVLARAASPVRAGEERWAARALAGLGVPILATPRGHATFEGADALWMAPDHVLLGVGRRTNGEGARLVEAVAGEQGARVTRIEMPASGAQHLLGLVVFLDRDLVAVRTRLLPPALRTLLGEGGYRLVEIPDDEEMTKRRGMNLVTVRPREVLMPADCPGIVARLQAEGVTCHQVDVDPYLVAAGGVACLSGLLSRSTP